MFHPLPDKPDHPALELEILELWEREGTFEQLRERNRGGPTWSFIDGPVTANKSLAVHTAWGRTLKDVFQRYKALRGFDQRYQNGFDCQGLWIEVGVERELGLNSKREIEEYGLEEFARRCREVVVRSSEELTRGSPAARAVDGLGQRLLHVQRHEHRVHLEVPEDRPRARLALHGPPLDRVVPALRHVALAARADAGRRLPGPRRPVALRALPAPRPRRASRSSSGRRRRGRCRRTSPRPSTRTPTTGGARTASGSRSQRFPDDTFVERVKGSELVGLRYRGPFDDLQPGSEVEHRVIPWDDVTMDQGTGIVHIAPGCGGEDFELSKRARPARADAGRRVRPLLRRLRLAARRSRRPRSADQIIGVLGEKGLLVESTLYTHRYPHCWRCDTPLIFRLSDDWFISVDEIRPKLLEENAKVAVGARVHGQAHGRLAAQHGRLEHLAAPLLRAAAAVLPVRVRPSERDRLEGRARASARSEGFDELEELRRPWIDRVPIRCEPCGEVVTRVPEVGDVWLDAGIVPFSTLGWENPEWIEEGYATGAARG